MPNAHTPGPWELRQAENGKVSIYPVGGPYRVADSYDGLGNARLIAAAPALLEALEALVKAGHTLNADSSMMTAARAAIAKAKGESK